MNKTPLYGVRIKSCEGVYSPAEDSFLLAEALDVGSGVSVLDMGCGSGFLGLVAAKTAGRVLSVDVNQSALECTEQNARLNGSTNLEVRRSDLFSNIAGSFDFILFNPPYLPTEEGEPRDAVSLAWDGGQSGRDVIDRFLADVSSYLNLGGRIYMLGSSLSDYEKTISVLESYGFQISLVARRKLDFEELVVMLAVYDF